MKKLFALLLGVVLTVTLFGACQPTGQDPEPAQSQPSADMPSGTDPLAMNLLTSSQLDVPGNYSRCSITSTGICWEVENGFYFLLNDLIYYADKTDLSNWIPVCGKADCAHIAVGMGANCDARAERVFIGEDRIYKLYEADYPFTLLSTALDGTDLREEFVFTEAAELIKRSGSGNVLITSEYLICYTSTLNPQGTFDFRVYTANKDGVILHMNEERENMGYYISSCDSLDGSWFCGPAIVNDPSRCVYFKLQNRELTSVDLTGLPTYGAYFTGDELLAFRSNEGYYRIDTTTREEVKLAEPQLDDSDADIALPNCILESTLFYDWKSPGQHRRNLEHHEMWLFDGRDWLEVVVPDEFLTQDSDLCILGNVAVASDRLLLLAVSEDRKAYEPYQLYQILLTTDTPTLEYLATLG